MKDGLRIGLVGCGDFGKELARYFLETAYIAALCDVEMMEAAYGSAESDGRPVEFPLYPELEDER